MPGLTGPWPKNVLITKESLPFCQRHNFDLFICLFVMILVFSNLSLPFQLHQKLINFPEAFHCETMLLCFNFILLIGKFLISLLILI